MANNGFQQGFQAYGKWKTQVSRTVDAFSAWLDQHGLATDETRQRIRITRDTLARDRLTIAFVAEFSRGKTELINAVFFADYGRRLLPSAAGRTTMCPTEMLWDDQRNEAYIRLLPIETRNQETSVSELKADPKQWVHYPLNLQSPEQMQSALQELVMVKRVPPDEAAHLGLYDAKADGDALVEGEVEIPRWRHAIISFPHPLLKQGLVILDTPGLNALGSEPELTLSTLPAAQAILFVLAADAGVTRSDLEMWQHHIQGFQASRRQGLMVVLNKIDVLWDDLRGPGEVEAAIAEQRSSTARILGVKEDVVFPVSAAKGLVGKVCNDPDLLQRSALPALEEFLSSHMLRNRQAIVMRRIEAEVGQLMESQRGLVAQQLNNVKRQLHELEQLRDKSEDVINRLLEKTRAEQAQYLASIGRFQSARHDFQSEIQSLRELTSIDRIDALIGTSHREMLKSWTTHGMRQVMRFLFDEFRRAMNATTVQTEKTRKRVRRIYQQFQNEFGFSSVQPQTFSTVRFRVELELLHQEAEAFRKSPRMAFSEQSSVARRFFHVLAGRGRDIFVRLDRGLDVWLGAALNPLVEQIHEHKEMMAKRLDNLQKIGQSKSTLQVRIEDLEDQYAELARQLTALRNMHNQLQHPIPVDKTEHPRPRLVASQGG